MLASMEELRLLRFPTMVAVGKVRLRGGCLSYDKHCLYFHRQCHNLSRPLPVLHNTCFPPKTRLWTCQVWGGLGITVAGGTLDAWPCFDSHFRTFVWPRTAPDCPRLPGMASDGPVLALDFPHGGKSIPPPFFRTAGQWPHDYLAG